MYRFPCLGGFMEIVRTPDERFAGLPDFPYEPGYVTFDDDDGGQLRVAFVDVGPGDGEVVLLMHGEPSWSFLYRRMIPVLVDAGLRVVAPDLVGFGRSDKPVDPAAYSYARHVEWMRRTLFDGLGLRDVTLVGQDWRADRVAAGGRAPGPVRPGDRGQHRAADRRHPDERGVPRLAAVRHDRRRVRRRPRGPERDGEPAAARGGRRLRRALPRRPLQGRRPGLPEPGAHRARRPGRGGQPRRVGGAGPVRQAVPDRVLRRRPDHRRWRPDLPEGGPGRPGPAARHPARWRALPAGGRRPGARPRGGAVRRQHVTDLFAKLERVPDVEAPDLVAVDATDRLLLDEAAPLLAAAGRGEVAVVDDSYGALTLGAVALHDAVDVRVSQDLLVAEQALARNAERTGLAGSYRSHALEPELAEGARVVLVKAPKGLEALREIAEVVAATAAPDVTVLVGGRVKHMTHAMNDVLRDSFTEVSAALARQKSRVLVARGPRPAPSSFPRCQEHPDLGLTVCAHGAAFAGTKIDLGVCNPPFHVGAAVVTTAADRLFAAAGRVLRPGGELWTVYNSALRYKPTLSRLVGPTVVATQTPKFTVTVSTRR